MDRIKNEELADAQGGSAAGKMAQGGGVMGYLGIGKKGKQRHEVVAERNAAQKELRMQAAECVKVMQLFKEGSLLLDEVDLILHPSVTAAATAAAATTAATNRYAHPRAVAWMIATMT